MYKQGRGTDLISLSLRFPIYQGSISDSNVGLTDTACAENLAYIRTNVRVYFPSFQQNKKARPSPFFGQVFIMLLYKGFPHSSVGKESDCNAGDPSSIPMLGKSPGEGNGHSFTPVFLLENPMDRGGWQAIVHGVTRVRHDLATKPPSQPCCIKHAWTDYLIKSSYYMRNLLWSLFLRL